MSHLKEYYVTVFIFLGVVHNPLWVLAALTAWVISS